MTALSILQATLAALNLGAAYTHFLEMRPKRAMAGKDWLMTQQAYGDFGNVAGMTMPMSTALSLARALRARRTPGRAVLLGVHAPGTLATVGIWATVNKPVNREIVAWNPDDLPANWRQRRDRWEFGHAASAGVHLVGFAAQTGALLRDVRR